MHQNTKNHHRKSFIENQNLQTECWPLSLFECQKVGAELTQLDVLWTLPSTDRKRLCAIMRKGCIDRSSFCPFFFFSMCRVCKFFCSWCCPFSVRLICFFFSDLLWKSAVTLVPFSFASFLPFSFLSPHWKHPSEKKTDLTLSVLWTKKTARNICLRTITFFCFYCCSALYVSLCPLFFWRVPVRRECYEHKTVFCAASCFLLRPPSLLETNPPVLFERPLFVSHIWLFDIDFLLDLTIGFWFVFCSFYLSFHTYLPLVTQKHHSPASLSPHLPSFWILEKRSACSSVVFVGWDRKSVV